jgi:hypothetical protein
MFGYKIVKIWLATEFVYSLGNLVASSVSQAGEEGEESGGEGCTGGITEDDSR